MKLKWTLWMILLTPVITLVTTLAAGGGHGTSVPLILCYPIMLHSEVFQGGGGPYVWGVLLGQFPLYGLLIDFGRTKWGQRIVAGIILVFHAVLILTVPSIE